MSASETKWVRLGEYIEQSDKRNSDGALTETLIPQHYYKIFFLST